MPRNSSRKRKKSKNRHYKASNTLVKEQQQQPSSQQTSVSVFTEKNLVSQKNLLWQDFAKLVQHKSVLEVAILYLLIYNDIIMATNWRFGDLGRSLFHFLVGNEREQREISRSRIPEPPQASPVPFPLEQTPQTLPRKKKTKSELTTSKLECEASIAFDATTTENSNAVTKVSKPKILPTPKLKKSEAVTAITEDLTTVKQVQTKVHQATPKVKSESELVTNATRDVKTKNPKSKATKSKDVAVVTEGVVTKVPKQKFQNSEAITIVTKELPHNSVIVTEAVPILNKTEILTSNKDIVEETTKKIPEFSQQIQSNFSLVSSDEEIVFLKRNRQAGEEFQISNSNTSTADEGIETAARRNSLFLSDEVPEVPLESTCCAKKNEKVVNSVPLNRSKETEEEDFESVIQPSLLLLSEKNRENNDEVLKNASSENVISSTRTCEISNKVVEKVSNNVEEVADDEWPKNVNDQIVVARKNSEPLIEKSIDHDDHCQNSIKDASTANFEQNLMQKQESEIKGASNQAQKLEKEYISEESSSKAKTHDIRDMQQQEFVQNTTVQEGGKITIEKEFTDDLSVDSMSIMNETNLKNPLKTKIESIKNTTDNAADPNAEQKVEQSNYDIETKKADESVLAPDHFEPKNVTSHENLVKSPQEFYIPPPPPPPPPNYLVKQQNAADSQDSDSTAKKSKSDKPKMSAAEKALIKELESINDPTFVGFLKTQLNVKSYSRDRTEQEM